MTFKVPSSDGSTEESASNIIGQQQLQKDNKSKLKKLHKRGMSFGSRLNDRFYLKIINIDF